MSRLNAVLFSLLTEKQYVRDRIFTICYDAGPIQVVFIQFIPCTVRPGRRCVLNTVYRLGYTVDRCALCQVS